MGKRDSNGKHLKWAGWEKRMVKDLKAQSLLPSRQVLQARSRVERLEKFPMTNPPKSHEIYPNPAAY